MIVRPATHVALIALLGIAVLVIADPAFAQTGVSTTLRQVSKQTATSTPLVAVLSYVCGAFFAASGLFKLKDWINEGDKVGIKPALFRLVISAWLIMLPHALYVVAGTWFGRSDGNVNVNVDVAAPNLGAFQRSR